MRTRNSNSVKSRDARGLVKTKAGNIFAQSSLAYGINIAELMQQAVNETLSKYNETQKITIIKNNEFSH